MRHSPDPDSGGTSLAVTIRHPAWPGPGGPSPWTPRTPSSNRGRTEAPQRTSGPSSNSGTSTTSAEHCRHLAPAPPASSSGPPAYPGSFKSLLPEAYPRGSRQSKPPGHRRPVRPDRLPAVRGPLIPSISPWNGWERAYRNLRLGELDKSLLRFLLYAATLAFWVQLSAMASAQDGADTQRR